MVKWYFQNNYLPWSHKTELKYGDWLKSEHEKIKITNYWKPVTLQSKRATIHLPPCYEEYKYASSTLQIYKIKIASCRINPHKAKIEPHNRAP